MGPIAKLLLFSFAMLTLPIGGFFASKSYLFEGMDIKLSSYSGFLSGWGGGGGSGKENISFCNFPQASGWLS